MPAVFEMNGIRFLRRLIHTEPRKHADGRPDLGWCCCEHSIIASLAWRLLGLEVQRCEGKMIIGSHDGPKQATIVEANPHFFLLIGDRVFDSSVTFGRIQGLPVPFEGIYPELGVEVFPEREPKVVDWTNRVVHQDKKLFALYAARTYTTPDAKDLTNELDTPFGEWLTKKFGKQSGLIGKAAWIAADILCGRFNLELSWQPSTGKEGLWDAIAAIPDKDGRITSRLAERARTSALAPAQPVKGPEK